MHIIINANAQVTYLHIHQQKEYLFAGLQTGIVNVYHLQNFNLLHQYNCGSPNPQLVHLQLFNDFLFALISSNHPLHPSAIYMWNINTHELVHIFCVPDRTIVCFLISHNTLITFCQPKEQNINSFAWCLQTGSLLDRDSHTLLKTKLFDHLPVRSCINYTKDKLIITALIFTPLVEEAVFLYDSVTNTFASLFTISSIGPLRTQLAITNHLLLVIDSASNVFIKNLRDLAGRKITFSKPFSVALQYDDYVFIGLNSSVKMIAHGGYVVQRFKYMTFTVSALAAYDNKLFAAYSNGDIFLCPLNIAAEDTVIYTNKHANKDSIISRPNVRDCTNLNLIELSPFTDDHDPIIIYLPNSNDVFQKAICITEEELVNFLRSDIDVPNPSNIMAIYTRPQKPDTTGIGSSPTGKIVIKLPVNNVYITYGSAVRIFDEMILNKIWYAVPLYGGKKRRVGNIHGTFGISMNHGQIPGEVVFKLFSPDDIHDINGIVAQETDSDWPDFINNTSSKLSTSVTVDTVFVNLLINELTFDFYSMMSS